MSFSVSNPSYSRQKGHANIPSSRRVLAASVLCADELMLLTTRRSGTINSVEAMHVTMPSQRRAFPAQGLASSDLTSHLTFLTISSQITSCRFQNWCYRAASQTYDAMIHWRSGVHSGMAQEFRV